MCVRYLFILNKKIKIFKKIYLTKNNILISINIIKLNLLIISSQLCKYFPFLFQMDLTALKCTCKVKKSLYLYNIRNFFFYPTWDVTRYNILIVSHKLEKQS